MIFFFLLFLELELYHKKWRFNGRGVSLELYHKKWRFNGRGVSLTAGV